MDWSYDAWPSGEPYDWGGAARGSSPHDAHDFHVDLGCGKVKKGRIGVDHFAAPGVNILMDLNTLRVYSIAGDPGLDAEPPERGGELRVLHVGLPFPDNSIESIVSHHAFEHIGEGFVPLIDEVYRVLMPNGILRAVTPLFPSRPAVEDPTHCRYFTEHTWDSFCGTPGELPTNCWQASFSVPYTTARFEKIDQDITARHPDPREWWGEHDVREIRVALEARK